MDDKVLDILETVGYNGVPSRENKDSVKKIIEYVLKINTFAHAYCRLKALSDPEYSWSF
jgi:hypothetical protein